MDSLILKSPELENHIFSYRPVCVYYKHNSKTNNRKSKLGILNLYGMEMLFETFSEDQTNSLLKINIIHYSQ